MLIACKSCDGKKVKTRIDGWKVIVTDCSHCHATGTEPEISKSKRRFFRKKIDDDTENNSVEAQTQKFLRAHGY